VNLEFQPISSVFDATEWLPFVEILALFNGSCAIDDFDWDEGSLLDSLLEDTADIVLRTDYEAEPNTGIQVAKDRFISDLIEQIEERRKILGVAYPFNLPNDGAVLLERKPTSEVSEAAIAYLWLSLFWVFSSQSDYLIVSKTDREEFVRQFSKIFEWICCLLMTSRSPSAVWYFGDSRDSREFLRRLQKVVERVGNGTVKDFNQLQVNQQGTNDGGVDILAVPTYNNVLVPNTTAFLVGATIQKTDRTGKILGHDQITRYRDYFLVGPLLAYQGVLAVPFDGTAIDQANCRDKNCVYINKAEILRILANYPVGSNRLSDIRSPRRKMRSKSRDLSMVATLISKGVGLKIAWV
jgi:hypothetical protein